MSSSSFWWLLLPIPLWFGFRYVLNRNLKNSAKEARRHAILIGLTVEEVEREVPYFQSNHQPPELRREKTISYSLKHRTRKNSHWSFLQRENRKDMKFPNGWHLVIYDGQVPERLAGVLEEVAKDWDGEYLEFEFYPDKICAFWEEWGGKNITQEIHDFLSRISEAGV